MMFAGMGFGMIFMVFFWVAIIALVVWGVGLVARGGSQSPKNEGTSSPLELASQRYARGEISRKEYELLKKDLKAD